MISHIYRQMVITNDCLGMEPVRFCLCTKTSGKHLIGDALYDSEQVVARVYA